jgi:hypothetical protein
MYENFKELFETTKQRSTGTSYDRVGRLAHKIHTYYNNINIRVLGTRILYTRGEHLNLYIPRERERVYISLAYIVMPKYYSQFRIYPLISDRAKLSHMLIYFFL